MHDRNKTPYPDHAFAERLKSRLSISRNQTWLAGKINLTRQAVYRYTKGQVPYDYAIIKDMAKFLGVEADWLMPYEAWEEIKALQRTNADSKRERKRKRLQEQLAREREEVERRAMLQERNNRIF